MAKRYLQFPLMLMRHLMDEPAKRLNQIFVAGLLHYAEKITLSDAQIADRTIYSFYNGGLPSELRERLNDASHAGKFLVDDFYKGFDGSSGKFDPEDNRADILSLFPDDPGLKELATEHARLQTAIYNLENMTGFDLTDLKTKEPDQWELGNISIPEKEPRPTIEAGLLLQLIVGAKTELELIQFAAYISAHSMLGRVNYKFTNKEHFLSRMFGYKSKKDVPEDLHPLHEKYLKRYHFEKLKLQLEANWGILFYSDMGIRGFFIAKGAKMTYDDLAFIAEGKKLASKKKRLNEAKKAARAKARAAYNKY